MATKQAIVSQSEAKSYTVQKLLESRCPYWTPGLKSLIYIPFSIHVKILDKVVLRYVTFIPLTILLRCMIKNSFTGVHIFLLIGS